MPRITFWAYIRLFRNSLRMASSVPKHVVVLIIVISSNSSQLFNFNRADSSTLRPTPNLEGQGISLGLVSQLEPVWLGWPYQKLSFRQHSLLHRWYSQGPPTRLTPSSRWRYQRGVGVNNCYELYFIKCISWRIYLLHQGLHYIQYWKDNVNAWFESQVTSR